MGTHFAVLPSDIQVTMSPPPRTREGKDWGRGRFLFAMIRKTQGYFPVPLEIQGYSFIYSTLKVKKTGFFPVLQGVLISRI